jgi:hypothetical protein
MNKFKYLALAAVTGIFFTAAAPQIQAQVSFNIGVAPVCPYGYYDYAPYPCAPYGYYGPEWFNGGVFIGAGPWFHGRRDFYGHVNNRFDPHRGYHGHMPARGERAARPAGRVGHFRGNEMRDGRGHVGGGHDGGRH